MAIGCIQAQRCHTNHCFAGVATHHPWLVRGVDPTSKAARLGNYIITLRKDVLALSRACGVPQPALITADPLELLDDRVRFKDHRRTLWIWPRLWITVPDQLRGGASHHEIVTRFRRDLHGGGRMQDYSHRPTHNNAILLLIQAPSRPITSATVSPVPRLSSVAARISGPT